MPVPRRHPWLLIAALALVAGMTADATRASGSDTLMAAATVHPGPARKGGPVITAAGDIAIRNHPGRAQTATAALIRRVNPNAVLTLGDNQYPRGELSDFRTSYAPTWGRFLGKTFPVLGNHDHDTPRARGYFAYFGKRSHGRPGWYAYSLGSWRMIALDSIFGGAPPGAELRWLRHELRNHPRGCQLAYFHHPRFSSGSENGSNPRMRAFWSILQRYGVDVVLNGHDHDYERFSRLLPSGRPSPRGIREFVVGTGGATLRPFGNRIVRGSEVRRVMNGVLRMQLRRGSYGWAFIRIGGAIKDRGTTPCH
jgi:hypothetical protein